MIILNICIGNKLFKVFTMNKASTEIFLESAFFSFLELLRMIPGLLEAWQRLYEQIVNAEQHSKSGEIAAIKLPHQLASGINHENNEP